MMATSVHELVAVTPIGDDLEKEKDRSALFGSKFIIDVGVKLKVEYSVIGTAITFFHKFYSTHSFRTFPPYITACACLFLAGKVEEMHQKCTVILKVAKSLLNEESLIQFGDDPVKTVYELETMLLLAIHFQFNVDHPYKHLLVYSKHIKADSERLESLIRMAWTFVNDGMCTRLCTQINPKLMAIAMIYLAEKLSNSAITDWIGKTPKHNVWWDMFAPGVLREELENISRQVLNYCTSLVPETSLYSSASFPLWVKSGLQSTTESEVQDSKSTSSHCDSDLKDILTCTKN